MALSFGTSGLRGLVSEFESEVVEGYVRSFVRVASEKYPGAKGILIGGDFRSSTPDIVKMIIKALDAIGISYLDLGLLPTPALAYACQETNTIGLMVTGSHIPDNRNGIKFYYPDVEILKDDEIKIKTLAQDALALKSYEFLGEKTDRWPAPEQLRTLYVKRYTDFFSSETLNGQNILFYEHSSACKHALPQILKGLGASVTPILASQRFIPVDTEAIDDNPELEAAASSGKYFATLSTDGDGDRPLMIDENGIVLKGDQLCALAALELNVARIVTPVSSNSAIGDVFKDVEWTKIGSPFVVERINTMTGLKAGFEANGGFILGSDIEVQGKTLKRLMTRDSVLPMLLVLKRAKRLGLSLGGLMQTLPPRATQSAVVRGIDPTQSARLISRLRVLTSACGQKVTAMSEIDGAKLTLLNGDTVHYRPSGNAPEFRVYVEAADAPSCKALAKLAMRELLDQE